MAELFSVIVPTCGRPVELRRCLEKLGGQSTGAGPFEIIVTNDRPTENPQLEREFPSVRWVAGPGRGPAANRNCGARTALGRWLVFLDDDCLPDGCWLESYRLAAAALPSARVLEGRTYAEGPKKSLCESAPLNETGGRLWSCNFAVEAEFFRTLGGFDERFPYAAMEDMDLFRRISATGERPSFVSNAAVCHPWRRITDWAFFRRQLESTLLYLEIHPQERKFLNANHFARVLVRRFVENSIPALFSGDFAGVKFQLYDHLLSLCLIEKLLFHRTVNAHPHHPGTSARS